MTTRVKFHLLSALLSAAALAFGSTTAAKTLRFASAFDPNSLDPHSLALLYQTRVVSQIYEGLVNRDKSFKLEPSLAVSWQAMTPTRLALQAAAGREVSRRRAVHRGRCRVFDRARAERRLRSARSSCAAITGVRKIDALTIDVQLCRARRRAARQAVADRDDEQGVGGKARRHAAAGLQRQAGDLRGAQCERHRAVRLEDVRARPAHRADREPALVGQERQRASAI